MEQRYQAVLAVIRDGVQVVDVGAVADGRGRRGLSRRRHRGFPFDPGRLGPRRLSRRRASLRAALRSILRLHRSGHGRLIHEKAKSVTGSAYDTDVARRRSIARNLRLSPRQAADEAIVRRYLRILVGAPTRRGDAADQAESDFIAVASRWADRVGVDRQALLALGVNRSTLDLAGIRRVPPNEWLRRYWNPAPFSIADLARRSGVSPAIVRRAIGLDEEAGLLRQEGRDGRTVLYGVA